MKEMYESTDAVYCDTPDKENPPLTTMSAPVYAMGMYGVSIVYNMVTSGQKAIPSPMRIKLPCKIEIRNSCKEV